MDRGIGRDTVSLIRNQKSCLTRENSGIEPDKGDRSLEEGKSHHQFSLRDLNLWT